MQNKTKSKRTKTILIISLSIMLSAILVLASYFFGTYILEQFADAADENAPGYEQTLFNGYSFSGSVADNCNILFADHLYRELDTAYSYAHDSDRYIAVHSIKQYEYDLPEDSILYTTIYSGMLMEIMSDKTLLIDTNSGETTVFSDKSQLYKYCKSNDINLCNWYYTSDQNGIAGIKTDLLNGYCLENRNDGTYNRGQSILLQDMPVFDGNIDEYASDNNSVIAFHLVIAYDDFISEYPEYSNKGLKNYSDEALYKIRDEILPMIRYPVHYDQYIIYDTENNEIFEFDSKDELESYSVSTGISLGSWQEVE